jgi:hypothetical protein
LVQERIGNTLELIGISKDFLNGTPAAQQLRDSIDKWDFNKGILSSITVGHRIEVHVSVEIIKTWNFDLKFPQEFSQL